LTDHGVETPKLSDGSNSRDPAVKIGRLSLGTQPACHLPAALETLQQLKPNELFEKITKPP